MFEFIGPGYIIVCKDTYIKMSNMRNRTKVKSFKSYFFRSHQCCLWEDLPSVDFINIGPALNMIREVE